MKPSLRITPAACILLLAFFALGIFGAGAGPNAGAKKDVNVEPAANASLAINTASQHARNKATPTLFIVGFVLNN